MNIETSEVTKILLTDVKALDPITIVCEDLGPRQGKINIDCYGKAWSAYWGGMGNRTVAEFFCSCDQHYLAKNLSDLRSTVMDDEGLKGHAKLHIIQLRKDDDIDKDEARDLFDSVDTWLDQMAGNEELLSKVYGEEWWYSLPDKPNDEYVYLCRIILAVQEGLNMQSACKAA